jgi:hypothetical protein
VNAYAALASEVESSRPCCRRIPAHQRTLALWRRPARRWCSPRRRWDELAIDFAAGKATGFASYESLRANELAALLGE